MRPVPTRALRPGAAAALAVLIAAPLVGGWAGSAARAAEPAALEAPAPAPEDIVVPEPDGAVEDTEPVEAEVTDAAAFETTDPEETEPSEPAAEPSEPAAEPTDAELETAEPMPSEPENNGGETLEPATASALQTVAAPVALVEPAEELEETPGLPTFEGADGCTYAYIEQEGSVGISDITGCTDVVVPVEIDGAPVETIGSLSSSLRMTGASQFTSLVLPDSLFAVGQGAFQDSDNLLSLDLGAGITKIGGQAFAGSDALARVELPASLTEVGARAFENASALATIDLGQVETIRGLAFSGAGQVTDLVLPASIALAEDTAFGNMPRLRTVQVEGSATALKKHTFFSTPALEKAVFFDGSSVSFIVGNMFQASGVEVVFFHDGAFGLDCDASEDVIGGATVEPRCLYAVDFDQAVPFFTIDLPHVEEGTIITQGPSVTPVIGEVHVGFEPSLPHTVTSDVTFLPVFEPATPGQYVPDEADLIQDLQGGFSIPGSVTAGETVTLVPDVTEPQPLPEEDPLTPGPTVKALGDPSPGGTEEPTPSGTEEPNPGGTIEPTDPEEAPDPNEVLDVWLFSEPLELEIVDLGFVDQTVTSLTVLVPANVEPGEHSLAVYSVFGELLGWQPLTVLPAAAPPAEEEDGSGDGAGGAGGAGGSGDGATQNDAEQTGATQTGATQTGATQTGALGAGLPGELSETGPAHTALALGAATALVAVGGLLVLARRFGS